MGVKSSWAGHAVLLARLAAGILFRSRYWLVGALLQHSSDPGRHSVFDSTEDVHATTNGRTTSDHAKGHDGDDFDDGPVLLPCAGGSMRVFHHQQPLGHR